MRKKDNSEYKGYLTEADSFTMEKALKILGVIAVIFAAATVGFIISLQRGEDHEAIGGAIRENTELKLRISELEGEKKELEDEIERLKAEAEKKNDGKEEDAEDGKPEQDDDSGKTEEGDEDDGEIRLGY